LRIERLVEAMFLEDVRRDARQLLNELSEHRGHASRRIKISANSLRRDDANNTR
jgi:hypothetical protein